jgi:hypothetical protein
MERVGREQPEPHEGDADDGDAARQPSQEHRAGDDGRRAQHDPDLERGGGQLIIMVARQQGVALMLGFLGALGKLGGALFGLRFRAVACGRLQRALPRRR